MWCEQQGVKVHIEAAVIILKDRSTRNRRGDIDDRKLKIRMFRGLREYIFFHAIYIEHKNL